MAVAGLALGRAPRVAAAPSFDLVVRGGTVLDGTGAPAFRADVGLVGDRIAALGEIAPEQGRRVIDASGLHVAPGFIDIHTHSDPDVLAYPTADSRARQGVTTELAGNCGSSAAPLAGLGVAERVEEWKRDGIAADWTDVGSYLARVEKAGLSVNHALLAGHGTLRSNAVGDVDRPLSAEESRAVGRALEDALDQGAFGLSTGLEYVPGRYTPTAEIVELARLVARRGGLYASHIRNEEARLLEAVAEAIEVGRQSGARVEIAHLKAAGDANWPKQGAALDLLESARRDGVAVLADAYPYTAYSTTLTTFMEGWAREGGTGGDPGPLPRPRGPRPHPSRGRGAGAGRPRQLGARRGEPGEDGEEPPGRGRQEPGRDRERLGPRPGGRLPAPARGGGHGRVLRRPRDEPGERRAGAAAPAGDDRLGRLQHGPGRARRRRRGRTRARTGPSRASSASTRGSAGSSACRPRSTR